MMEDVKPCIHAEVCADGCDLEDITECGYYQAERTCRIVIEDECSVCSECNEDIDPSWVACPYCGARVERDA